MKKIAKLLVIGVLALTVTGCGSVEVEINGNDKNESKGGITLDEYNKITTGMSYDDVKEIVGDKCSKSSSAELAGMTQEIYTCDGESSDSTVMLTFQNDSLTLKTQVGLE